MGVFLGSTPALDPFTEEYVATALFTTDDDDGNSLDRNYTVDDIDPATLQQMIDDCADFQRDFDPDIHNGWVGRGSAQRRAGGVFWLNRNGHGVTFEDGDWRHPHDKTLRHAAKSYGEFDLYVGDDGKIYGSPLKRAKAPPPPPGPTPAQQKKLDEIRAKYAGYPTGQAPIIRIHGPNGHAQARVRAVKSYVDQSGRVFVDFSIEYPSRNGAFAPGTPITSVITAGIINPDGTFDQTDWEGGFGLGHLWSI